MTTSCTNVFVNWILYQLNSLPLGFMKPTPFTSGPASRRATLGGVGDSDAEIEATGEGIFGSKGWMESLSAMSNGGGFFTE